MNNSWIHPQNKDVQDFLSYYEAAFRDKNWRVPMGRPFPVGDRLGFCSALNQLFTEMAVKLHVWMLVQDLKQEPALRFKRKGPKCVHGTIKSLEEACELLRKCCDQYANVPLARKLAGALQELAAEEALACAAGLRSSGEDSHERDFVKAIRKILNNIRHEFYPLGAFYPGKNEIVLYYETIGEELTSYGITDPWEAPEDYCELMAHVFAHEYFHALHCDQAPFLFEKHQKDLRELCGSIIEAEADFAAFALTIVKKDRFWNQIAERQYHGWKEPKPYFWPYDRALEFCTFKDLPLLGSVDREKFEEEFRWSLAFSKKAKEVEAF